MRANTLANGGAGDIWPGRFCLAHRGKRQRANRGKTARHQAGPAEETAAIEAASGLIADRRREMAATRLTFCSLDQHGCISLSSGSG